MISKTMKKIARNNNRRLSFKNLHDRDQHIHFQEKGHIYTVKGKTGYTSVTTLVHKHSKPFDENAAIKRIIENQTNEKYKGMTEADIKMLWKVNGIEARTLGTKMHYGIECHYNNETKPDLWKNLDEEYTQFQAFLKDHQFLEAFRTEWAVYDEANKISGSIDMVFKNKVTGKYDIYDWKRTKEIKHRGFNKLQADFLSNIPDSNYWLYSLQLNVYKYILETNYDIDVGDLWLVAIHPEQPFYRKLLRLLFLRLRRLQLLRLLFLRLRRLRRLPLRRLPLRRLPQLPLHTHTTHTHTQQHTHTHTYTHTTGITFTFYRPLSVVCVKDELNYFTYFSGV